MTDYTPTIGDTVNVTCWSTTYQRNVTLPAGTITDIQPYPSETGLVITFDAYGKVFELTEWVSIEKMEEH